MTSLSLMSQQNISLIANSCAMEERQEIFFMIANCLPKEYMPTGTFTAKQIIHFTVTN